jgi:hypothetical protein
MNKKLILFLIACNVTIVHAQNFYVSPKGNNSNAGTKEKPFATLDKARQAVTKTNDGTKPVTVYLRQGVYALVQPFKLSTEDGGTKAAPITYTAYGDEKVFIRGSKTITAKSFTEIKDAATLSRIAVHLKDSILCLDLAALSIQNIKTYANNFDDDGGLIELYMDEKRMPLSRYPNSGDMMMKKVLINGGGQETKGDWGEYYGEKPPPGLPPRQGVFEYWDERTSTWVNALDRGVWLKGFWRIPWQNEAVRISKIDTIAKTITLSVPVKGGIGNKYTRPEGNGKEPYWLLNLLEEIDMPGEWAIDFKDKKLYFYPPKKITDENFRIADISEPLIQLNNAANISIKKITVEENIHDGIKINGGENNLVAGCTIRNVTKNAITVDGGKDHTVLSNDMYDLGAGGVWLSGGDEKSTPRTPANFKVINNHIYRYSLVTRIYAAGINAGFSGGGGGGHHQAVGMYVAHNMVHDAPHVGILFGSWDSKFEYNEVFDYCQVSDDMGAFYSYDQAYRMGGHSFAYNFIHNAPIGDGIYFDEDHRDMKIYSNIISLNSDPKRRGTGFLYKSGTQAKKNFPHNMECYNNITINCNVGYQFVTLPSMVDNNKIYNNVSVIDGKAFRNRILAADNKERDTAFIPSPTAKQNIAYNEDPGFVDLKKYNFQLKGDSKIFKDLPGFTPIPFNKIGLYIDEYRKRLPTDKEVKRFERLPKKDKDGTEILDRG